MSDKNNKYSFWSLICEHKIEIPIIQRDYAQGRLDSKAAQIREGFVYAIVSAIEKQEALHLDFVYGKVKGKIDTAKIENNKKAITNLLKSVQSYSENLDINIKYEVTDPLSEIIGEINTIFIPLDGQQRLTTLFLIHWYIINKLQNIKGANDILGHFSYKTRRSSKDFCKSLVENSFNFDKDILKTDENSVFSNQLKESPWFYSSWKKDPTVRGMLTVLDEIHKNLKDKSDDTLSNYWKTLTETNIISFDFLDLDKFDLTDELYVKMNARGKHLSDFENFKAWLLELVEGKSYSSLLKDWQIKLDIAWSDLFWSFKEKGRYEVDKEYMTFFNMMVLFFYVENVNVSNYKLLDTDLFMVDFLRKFEFVPHSVYQELDSFSEPNLNNILNILYSLENEGYSSENAEMLDVECFNHRLIMKMLFGKDNSNLNYWDTTYIYSFTSFLNKKRKKISEFTSDEKLELKQWLRICKNLIYNTTIDSQVSFVLAVQEINKLSEHALNIYDFIAKQSDDIKFFAINQIAEEELKCGLIAINPCWESEFIEYEKHDYFLGQIGFLLYCCKTENDSYDLEVFKDYAIKASAIFSDEILNESSYILQRALLTKGDYLIQVGCNYGFCIPSKGTLRNREENWRKVFRIKPKLDILKELLDDIHLDIDDIEKSLNTIIVKSTVSDWRFNFIKNKHAIDYCRQKLIRYEDNGKFIMLLNSSNMVGYHADLYSYTYYLDHIKGNFADFYPFKEAKYHSERGSVVKPSAYLGDFLYKDSKYELKIIFTNKENEYKLRFFEITEKEIDDSLIKVLLLNNFIKSENNFSYSIFIEEKDIKNTISLLCNSLKELI